MEVVLLGTGSADGWPNPFCRCESCMAQREQGVIRHQTAALVDDRLLLDCGADAPAAASRLGRDLADVTDVLVTHAHTDHLDPSFLLHRSWVSTAPLTVHGPAPVVSACREWLAPDQRNVTLHEVTAGETFAVPGYEVSVLPAAHHALGEAVLYHLRGGRGSLLYATDTGPLPDPTVAALADASLDLVLVEQTFGDRDDLAGAGHLSLSGLEATVRRLRSAGAVTRHTGVYAVHLSHHNPPEPVLTQRLGELGVTPGRDGMTLRPGTP